MSSKHWNTHLDPAMYRLNCHFDSNNSDDIDVSKKKCQTNQSKTEAVIMLDIPILTVLELNKQNKKLCENKLEHLKKNIVSIIDVGLNEDGQSPRLERGGQNTFVPTIWLPDPTIKEDIQVCENNAIFFFNYNSCVIMLRRQARFWAWLVKGQKTCHKKENGLILTKMKTLRTLSAFFFQRMYGHLLREFCKDSTLACIILKIEAPSSFKNVMKTGNNGLFLRKSIYQGQSGIFKQFSKENDKIK